MTADSLSPIARHMLPTVRSGGSWRVVSASVRGAHHEALGLPCQDSCDSHITSNDVLIAAVADGASSAAHSEIGSAVATRAAIETLCAAQRLPDDPHDVNGWEKHLTEALEAAVHSVRKEASWRQVAVRDLATTLILVAATPLGAVAVQVGDGAVVIGDRHENLIALTAPPAGEYANETDFLCSPNLIKVAQGRYWPVAPRYVAIFSDGLQRLALQLPAASPHAAFFSPLFRFVSEASDRPSADDELAAFLQSPRVRARTDDDATLLLAHLPEAEP
jgi:hypothetical protein